MGEDGAEEKRGLLSRGGKGMGPARGTASSRGRAGGKVAAKEREDSGEGSG